VKIFFCQPFVKNFAKKQRDFRIVLEALFNHEEHEGHESNKKLERGNDEHDIWMSSVLNSCDLKSRYSMSFLCA
jgi:hypothetical protein